MNQVQQICIRATGREFEEEFRSDSPLEALRAGQELFSALPAPSGRRLWEIEPGRVRVKWWGMD